MSGGVFCKAELSKKAVLIQLGVSDHPAAVVLHIVSFVFLDHLAAGTKDLSGGKSRLQSLLGTVLRISKVFFFVFFGLAIALAFSFVEILVF